MRERPEPRESCRITCETRTQIEYLQRGTKQHHRKTQGTIGTAMGHICKEIGRKRAARDAPPERTPRKHPRHWRQQNFGT